MALSDLLLNQRKPYPPVGGSGGLASSLAGAGGAGNPAPARGLAGLFGGNPGVGMGQQAPSPGVSSTIGSPPPPQDQGSAGNITAGAIAPNPQNQKQPGVMSRLFDVLSRPEYAMASMAKGVMGLDRQNADETAHPGSVSKLSTAAAASKYFNPGGILKGLSQGIQGKDKTTFTDILNQDKVDPLVRNMNPVLKTGLGLAMGVGFDPTTYLSGGLSDIAKGITSTAHGAEGVKALSTAEKLAQAGKAGTGLATAAADTQKAGTLARAVAAAGHTGASVARELRPGMLGYIPKNSEELAVNIAAGVGADGKRVVGRAGGKFTSKLADQQKARLATMTEVKGVTPSLFGDPARPVGHLVSGSSKLPTDARAVQLKLLGNPVASSTALYKAGRAVTDPLRYSSFGQLLGDTFKAGHTLPADVHNLQRMYAGIGRMNTREKALEAAGVFKHAGIGKEEDHAIWTAIQNGVTDTLPKEQKTVAHYLMKNLHDMHPANSGKVFDPARDIVKFDSMSPYKGAKTYDRASHNFIAQYDKTMRERSYSDLMREVSRRFPSDANLDEVNGALQKSKQIFGVQGENSAKWRAYMNKFQDPWKKYVTVYRPGFQIKHMLGDGMNAYLAGTDPARFVDSAKILAKDTKHIDEGAKSIRIGGQAYSPTEVDNLYRSVGLESGFINTEIAGAKNRGIAHAMTNFSSQREKYTRMATFLTNTDKYAKQGLDLRAAAEKASAVVRKYHFDYADLTPAERNIRSFVPFYTYTKNELPLLLEHTLTNPHQITQVSRGGKALSQLAGVPSDPNNPYPGIDQVMPTWMSAHQVIPTGHNRAVTPNLPTDHLSWLDPMQAVKGAQGMVTPLIKAPIEMVRGKTFDGIPIKRAGSQGRGKWSTGGTPAQSNLDANAHYLAGYLPYGGLARGGKTSIADRLVSIATGIGAHTVRGKPSKGSKWAP